MQSRHRLAPLRAACALSDPSSIQTNAPRQSQTINPWISPRFVITERGTKNTTHARASGEFSLLVDAKGASSIGSLY